MKFDICIGNPPYNGYCNGKISSLYDKFIQIGDCIASKTSFIIPAKYFNTLNSEKELNHSINLFAKSSQEDEHVYIKDYFPYSDEIFKKIYISGGILIRIRDDLKKFNKSKRNINAFRSAYDIELAYKNIQSQIKNNMMDKCISSTYYYKWSKDIQKEYNIIPRITSNDVRKLVLQNKNLNEPNENCYGVYYINNLKRKDKLDIAYFPKEYFNYDESINTIRLGLSYIYNHNIKNLLYKINEEKLTSFIIDKNNLLTSSHIFVSNNITSLAEANNMKKYFNTKFVTIAVRLTTLRHNVYNYNFCFVPVEDFTDTSDVPWNKSEDEISLYLYKKYGFSNEVIKKIMD